MRSYEKALKSGIKLQEESVKGHPYLVRFLKVKATFATVPPEIIKHAARRTFTLVKMKKRMKLPGRERYMLATTRHLCVCFICLLYLA